MDHPDIKEVAVVSTKDRLRGKFPKAIVAAREGRELSEKRRADVLQRAVGTL